MDNDYRNTKYCPDFNNTVALKNELGIRIKKDHPGQEDMHQYVSPNEGLYKMEFLRAYNFKCSYCGVSIKIIAKSDFEIDHFIYKKSSEFRSVEEAGHIDNLVSSCRFCNRKKSSLLVERDVRSLLYPDGKQVASVFYRDNLYYITVSERWKGNAAILKYYKKLKLDAEIHRLDYLLMNLYGLTEKNKERPEVVSGLKKAILLLEQKRRLIG